MTLLLAGDIGGTKTLLATYRLDGGRLEQQRHGRYPSQAWPDFAAMVSHFLAAADSLTTEAPSHGCFAVAGPVIGGQVKVTNLPWQLDQQQLAAACGLDCLELVNDFAVLVYGLPHLAADQQQALRPLPAKEPLLSAPVAVLGAGTGLGTAIGVPGPSGLIAMASEAAHAEFAPRLSAEWRLKQWLQDDLRLDRLSVERVVSGTGLGHLFRWMLTEAPSADSHSLAEPALAWAAAERDGRPDRPDLPALVSAAAADGDPMAAEALSLWLGAYGSVAGDLALHCLCRGGLWVGGGTAAKLLHRLRSPAFLQPFSAKGRLSPVLEAIPLRAIVDPGAGLFSAACRARMLAGGHDTASPLFNP